jgi:uncharacterized membrane protein
MKKLILVTLAALATTTAMAATFLVNGVWYGTVCRSGVYYTVYPSHMAQAVGTVCPVRDAFGYVIAYGIVTNE